KLNPTPFPSSHFLAPGKRAVRDRMQPSFGVPRKAERLKQRAFAAKQLFGYQFADADHLVAVIGVCDDVDVVAKAVEHGKIVRCEAAYAARRLLPVNPVLILEALLAMRQRGGPHVGEMVIDDELG